MRRLDGMDPINRHKLELLATSFPSVSHEVLFFSLEASLFDVATARQVGTHSPIHACHRWWLLLTSTQCTDEATLRASLYPRVPGGHCLIVHSTDEAMWRGLLVFMPGTEIEATGSGSNHQNKAGSHVLLRRHFREPVVMCRF